MLTNANTRAATTTAIMSGGEHDAQGTRTLTGGARRAGSDLARSWSARWRALELTPAVWKTCPWQPRELIEDRPAAVAALRGRGAARRRRHRDAVARRRRGLARADPLHRPLRGVLRRGVRSLPASPPGGQRRGSMRDQLARTRIAWTIVARAGRGLRRCGISTSGSALKAPWGVPLTSSGNARVEAVTTGSRRRRRALPLSGQGDGRGGARAAELGWAGLEGDRRHAFVQSNNRSDFPWLTIRQVPALTTYVPSLRDGAVVVRTPAGRDWTSRRRSSRTSSPPPRRARCTCCTARAGCSTRSRSP